MPLPLVFDLDGTLTDPSEGITRCIRHALGRIGAACPPESDLARYIGPPLPEIFATILGEGDGARLATAAFRERYGTVGLFENRPYDGVADALAVLQSRGHRLFVGTSKPWQFAERILERFGLDRFFTRVYGCELTGERADKAELLAHLLQTEQLDGAVMIGDRKYDVAAARANGMRSIGVTWGFGSVDELREAGADAICDTPADLIQTV
jgi:phosphoglycolate phosphatase